MTAGIQVFNPDGSLQFDLTTRLYRVLTIVDTGVNDGNISVPDLPNQGTLAVSEISVNNLQGVAPTVSVNGGTVSWSFGSVVSADRTSAQLAIAVY